MPKGTTNLTDLIAVKARELGLSNPALAERAGVDYRLVLRLMKGQTVPHEYSVRTIADALGIPEAMWRPALVASRAARAADAQDPLYQYAADFLAAHQFIRPPALSQTNKEVRVRLTEVYVSLHAEAEADRVRREQDDLRLTFDPDDERSDGTAGATDTKVKPDVRDGVGLRRLESAPRAVDLATALTGNRIAIILGHPGAGKTTLMKHAGVRHAEALQAGAGYATDATGRSYGPARLSVYVRVADYAEKGDSRTLLDFVRTAAVSLTGVDGGELFDERWKRGSVLILLDGLDEITEPTRRDEINAAIEVLMADCRASGNQLVVSSRIHGYRMKPLESAPVFAICDMNREQVGRFFRSWCVAIEREVGSSRADAIGERRAEAILRAIDANAGVRGLAVNPLLCVLIALIQQANVVLPERRVVLMEKAVEALLRVWRLGQTGAGDSVAQKYVISPEEESHVLRPLAFWLHEAKPTGLAAEDELAEQIARGLAAMRGHDPGFTEGRQVEEFLGRVRNHSGILIERGQGYYGFLHLLFEEYLAGLQLVDDPDASIEFVRAHRHLPRWEEPIRLGIASLPKGHAARLIRKAILEPPSAYEDVLYRDLCLAARCLGDCEAVDAVLAVDIAGRMACAFLDPATGAAIEPLRESLGRSAHGLMMHQASTLALTEPLLDALKDKDEDSDVRGVAAQALGSAGQGSEAVVRALLAALKDKDEDSDVRGAAARALGSVGQGSGEVVRALLDALKGADSRIRYMAARALGNAGRGSEEVLRVLLAALKDKESVVRRAAAQALGSAGQGSEEVVHALLDALKGADSRMRFVAAQALGSVGQGSEEVVRALLDALSDEERSVRIAAVRALGNAGQGSEEALRVLLPALKDKEQWVRYVAAEVLGRAGQGSEEVVRVLLDALKNKDKDSDVRRAAAWALGSAGQGSEEVVRALLAALKNKDKDSDVRRAAAWALGSAGQGSEEVVRALLAALKDKDEDSDVRRAAAQALGSVGQGSEEVVRALLDALRDKDSDVRGAAAQALGSVGQGSEEVVHALLAPLKDTYEDSDVRNAAWEPLRSLVSR